AEDQLGSCEEGAEDLELERSQGDRRFPEPDRMPRAIEPDAPVVDCLRPFLAPPRALEDDIDARHQLARREWLGDIVVAANFETENAVDLLVASTQKQDRHF